jgi:hypothetical protein
MIVDVGGIFVKTEIGNKESYCIDLYSALA